MATNSQQQEEQESAASSLNAVIEATNHAETVSNIPPVKVAFASASALLTIVRVSLLLVHVSRLLANVHRTR